MKIRRALNHHLMKYNYNLLYFIHEENGYAFYYIHDHKKSIRLLATDYGPSFLTAYKFMAKFYKLLMSFIRQLYNLLQIVCYSVFNSGFDF